MGYLVTIPQARLVENKPCTNADWSMLKFLVPEVYKGKSVVPENANCSALASVKKLAQMAPFEVNKTYAVTVEVSVQQPQGQYPARLNFTFVEAK